jgi:hypothetical protein
MPSSQTVWRPLEDKVDACVFVKTNGPQTILLLKLTFDPMSGTPYQNAISQFETLDSVGKSIAAQEQNVTFIP